MKLFNVLLGICWLNSWLAAQELVMAHLPSDKPPEFFDATYIQPDVLWIGTYSTGDGGRTWRNLSRTDSPEIREVYATHFISPKVGLLAANSGTWRTADAGTAWVKVFDSPFAFIIDTEKELWMTAYQEDGPAIFVSDNRGESWVRNESVVGVAVRSVQRVAPDCLIVHRVVFGVHELVTTFDEGRTWGLLWRGQADEEVDSFMFLNTQVGWITLSNRHLLRTSDGGKRWKTHSLKQMRAWGVYFISKNHGLMINSIWEDDGSWTPLFETKDGGARWRPTNIEEVVSPEFWKWKKLKVLRIHGVNPQANK